MFFRSLPTIFTVIFTRSIIPQYTISAFKFCPPEQKYQAGKGGREEKKRVGLYIYINPNSKNSNTAWPC